MKILYCKEIDMAQIGIVEGATISATQVVTCTISHHYDAESKLIGLCVHNASYNLPKELLDAASVE